MFVGRLSCRSKLGLSKTLSSWSPSTPSRRKYHQLSSTLERGSQPIVSTYNSFKKEWLKKNRQTWSKGLVIWGRELSTAAASKRIAILYGSQTGTARLFANELAEALEELPSHDVSVQGLHEYDQDPSDIIIQPAGGGVIHVFVMSVAGVGEPTDNARKFFTWLTNQQAKDDDSSAVFQNLDYTVFGLGNQKAHPNHFNVIGKTVDSKLAELGANRIFDLGLGDDGDCIEDDFDVWMEGLLTRIATLDKSPGASPDSDENDVTSTSLNDDPSTLGGEEIVQLPLAEQPSAMMGSLTNERSDVTLAVCPGAKDASRKRRISSKYPMLQLTSAEKDTICENLLHLDKSSNQMYAENTMELPVVSNRPLSANGVANGLYEMVVSLDDHAEAKYETGDHLMVYPRNSDAMVEAVLANLDVDAHAVIEAASLQDKKYPHPTGITVAETLSHCVDLGAMPSPAFSRMILGRTDLDYRNEIAQPRRTVLEVMAESQKGNYGQAPLTLEELLYNLAPMRPRYYSIASSSMVSPNKMYLTYRPIQYVSSSNGCLRLGVCTSYMKELMGQVQHKYDNLNEKYSSRSFSHLIAAINSNPTFRLPADKSTPIMMIAGGCGIAPIRAFLEERVQCVTFQEDNPYTLGYLFVGFRSPADQVYGGLIDEAHNKGAITDFHISFATGLCDLKDHDSSHHCGLITEAMGENGSDIYSFLENGGYTYVCGGARSLGAAIQRELHAIIRQHGQLNDDEATEYLRKLLREGRYHEDLSD